MEQQVKTIRIKEGTVWVSPIEEPKQWDYESGGDPPSIPAYIDPSYYDVLDAYNASFVEVGNPEVITEWPFGDFVRKAFHRALYKAKDGDYPALEGLTMEVKHLCPNEDSFCEVCNCKQVATVKFTPAEKEEKPESKNQWLARRLRNNYGLLASYRDGNIQRVMRNLLDIADLIEKEGDLQQEITTLRAENWQKFYSKLYSNGTEFESLQKENERLRARIAELEKKQ